MSELQKFQPQHEQLRLYGHSEFAGDLGRLAVDTISMGVVEPSEVRGSVEAPTPRETQETRELPTIDEMTELRDRIMGSLVVPKVAGERPVYEGYAKRDSELAA